jgi:hypothetical protein
MPLFTVAYGKETALLIETGLIGENSESMAKRLVKSKSRLRTVAAFTLAAAATCCLHASGAGTFRRHKPADSSAPNKGPAPSQPAAFSIPVETLGFSTPGAFYLGARESLVSLDFLDENRILFTFRVPGLIHRTTAGEFERQIHALVLTLPLGAIETEALWTVHDRGRYLWMLRDGHFLLLDGDTIKEGNAKLELRPLLQFPGPLLSMQMDPGQQFLVTNSEEPQEQNRNKSDWASPATAQADVTLDGEKSTDERDIVLRILRRSTGEVMLVSHLRMAVRLPINGDGYVETLRGTDGRQWILDLNYFTGGSKVLGKLESSCQPPVEFVTENEAIVNACVLQNGRRLVAMSTEGKTLWDAASPPTQIWPLLVMGPNGVRVARETMTLDHSIESFGEALDAGDIKGQMVEVYDVTGGKLALKAYANPVLDAGGNVAISPSGKRVAVLNGGSIEVFELPEVEPRQAAGNPPAR